MNKTMDTDTQASTTRYMPDYPEAILRPISHEERTRHIWFEHAHTTTAVLCPTAHCGAFLAALVVDSGGRLHSAMIQGKREHMPGYWRVARFKRKGSDLHRCDRLAQSPLSGRPGRLKLLCPECYGWCTIVTLRLRRGKVAPES